MFEFQSHHLSSFNNLIDTIICQPKLKKRKREFYVGQNFKKITCVAITFGSQLPLKVYESSIYPIFHCNEPHSLILCWFQVYLRYPTYGIFSIII